MQPPVDRDNDLPGEPKPGLNPEGAADAVSELSAGMTGRWEVQTTGSVHVWDLDAGTYARRPRSPHGAMPHDGVDHPLVSVAQWPRLGEHSYVVFDDPRDALVEHWRRSGTIRSIRRLEA